MRVNEISAPIKETTESPFAPSTMPEHGEKMAVYEPGGRPSPNTKPASTLILDF